MTYFFYKLLPPRTTFPADMTPAEAGLMQQHALYWRNWMEAGHVIAFGPVADPKGTFGVAILQLEEGMDPHSLADNDPVIAAGVGSTARSTPCRAWCCRRVSFGTTL